MCYRTTGLPSGRVGYALLSLLARVRLARMSLGQKLPWYRNHEKPEIDPGLLDGERHLGFAYRKSTSSLLTQTCIHSLSLLATGQTSEQRTSHFNLRSTACLVQWHKPRQHIYAFRCPAVRSTASHGRSTAPEPFYDTGTLYSSQEPRLTHWQRSGPSLHPQAI